MHSTRSRHPAKKPTSREIQCPRSSSRPQRRSAMQSDVPGRPGHRRATGRQVLHDAGRRVVFPAAEPDPTVNCSNWFLQVSTT
jgi:hypothetical protein